MLLASSHALRALLLGLCLAARAACMPFAVDITEGTRSPDGYARPQILINGTSPGPLLQVNQGDHVEFLVRNHLQRETSIHFHGIMQIGTPWSDGVPGLSQKPIPPGGEFLYRWTANEYGTYFYHGHERSEISDGLYGPIYVKPLASEKRPFDKISKDPAAIAAMKGAEATPNFVLVSDWSHLTASEFKMAERDSNLDIYCTNSILVNGKGNVNCLSEKKLESELSAGVKALLNGTKVHPSGCSPFIPPAEGTYKHNFSAVPMDAVYGCDATSSQLETFVVDPLLQWASFNFISATNLQAPVISIDEHPMWIYAVDGRYIEPMQVDGLQLYNGERYSVMVQLNNTPRSYTMRFANYGFNQLISGFATLSYAGSKPGKATSKPYFTYGGAPVDGSVTQLNTSLIVPFPNIPPAKHADATHILHVKRTSAPWRWTLSGPESYPITYADSDPLLWYPNSPLAHNPNLVIRTTNGSWVDIVWVVEQDANDAIAPPHPMHKHSNKAYIIGAGTGKWKWQSVAEAAQAVPQFFNFETPALRDGFVTIPVTTAPTWLAIRYQSINPGAFLIHCHIQTHLAGGMAMAILDGVGDFPEIPYAYGPNGNDTGM